jgi:hypothetical protein
MTANEMRTEFDIGYDSIANMDMEHYDDKEVSHFLTKAQERLIKDKYNPKGNRYRSGVDFTEKRKKDLNELIKGPRDQNGSLVTSLSTYQTRALRNGTIFTIPDDVWFVIFEEAAVGVESCEDATITSPLTEDSQKVIYTSVTPVEYDYLIYLKNNPFRKPKDNNKVVWRVELEGDPITGTRNHELITGDSYKIHEYYIVYIKEPKNIVVDVDNPSNQVNCELSEQVHREVIDEAVNLALEASKSQRFKTHTAINQDSE